MKILQNLFKNKFLWLVILLLAIVLRFAFLLQLKSTPLFGFFAMDSQYYDAFALKILEGNFTFKESIYLNPFYPFILSLIYRIFGHSLLSVGFSQIIIDSITCIFLYFICNKVFKKKVIGLLASFFYACYSIAIFYTGFLLDTTFSVFFLAGMILLLLYAHEREKPWLWFSAGLLLGLSILLRPNIILFLPFLIFWLYTRENKRISRDTISLAFIFIGIFVTFLPFSIRNYTIGKRFSPLSVQGGMVFYYGNHPGATGVYKSLDGISDSAVEQVKQSILKASMETGRRLSPTEASNYWFSKGVQFIRENPRQYLFLMFRKLLLFWNEAEVEANINFYFSKKFLTFFNFPLFSFGILAPFALLGFIFALTRKHRNVYLFMLFIFAYMISVILIFITSRYRFPCIPFVIIMAAYALYNFTIVIKSKKIPDIVLFSVLLIAFFIITNFELSGIIQKENFLSAHNNLGVIYSEKGLLEEAIAEYQKALKINPDYAITHSNLGYVYLKKGMLEEAIAGYQKAIKLKPDFFKAFYTLGTIYHNKGMTEEAIAEYQKALRINPDYVKARSNLGNAYYEKGMLEEAIAEYQKALEIEQDSAKTHSNLAGIYYEKGMLEEAIEECQKALKIDQNYAEAYHNLGVIYNKKGMIYEAIKAYKKALEINPKDTETLNSLADLYSQIRE